MEIMQTSNGLELFKEGKNIDNSLNESVQETDALYSQQLKMDQQKHLIQKNKIMPGNSITHDQDQNSYINTNRGGQKKTFGNRVDVSQKVNVPTKVQKQVNFDQMNDKIQEMTARYYQHTNYIKNLKNIAHQENSNFSGEIDYGSIKDDDMKITDMFPVVSNGNVFSVLSINCRTKSKSLLVILKYNKEDKQMEQIYNKVLINNDEEEFITNNIVAVSNGDNIYYSVITNEIKQVSIEIWKYNFKKMNDEKVYERTDLLVPMVKGEEVNGIREPLTQDNFYASSSSLSLYYPTDKEEKILSEKHTIDEDEFMKNTYLTVDFRTKTISKDDDQDYYYSEYKIYRLSEFNAKNPQDSCTEKRIQSTLEQVFQQFVIGKKFYNSEVVDGKVLHQLNEIDSKEQSKKENDEPYWKGPVVFSNRQDVKSIEKDHNNHIKPDFRPTFAIFSERSSDQNHEYQSLFKSFNDNEKRKLKFLVAYQIYDYQMIDYYDKLAEHLQFKPGDVDYKKSCNAVFKQKQKGYESMNVIYNLQDKEVYVMAVVGSMHQVSTLKLSEEYLKKKEIKYLDPKKMEKHEIQRKVKNDDIVVSLKVSQRDGIQMQITSKHNHEVLLLKRIQKDQEDNAVYKMCGLAWSSKQDIVVQLYSESSVSEDTVRYTNKLSQRVQCGRVLSNKQVIQLLEYEITWDPDQLKGLILGSQEKISSSNFFKFLQNSTDIITINPVSMNIFALKDDYINDHFCMKSLNQNNGVEIMIINDKKQPYKIEIKNNESKYTFKSDLADSNYMIYYDLKNMKEEPQILQVYSTLKKSLSNTEQNPYLSSFHMRTSMLESNNQLNNLIEEDGNLFGFIKTQTLMTFFRQYQNKQSLDQIDRQYILQQQIRTIFNMAPIDYENLIFGHDQIGIFAPIEQLNCQCCCDFILKYPQIIKHVLQKDYQCSAMEQVEEKADCSNTEQVSLIKKFLNTQINDPNSTNDLSKSIEQIGLIRKKGEITSDLFLCNSLERCFITKKYTFWESLNPFRCWRKKNLSEQPKIQTAKMLIDNMLKSKYDKHQAFYVKNIMLAASNSILQCNLNPYPFNNFSKFYEIPDQPEKENEIGICFFQNLDDVKSVLFNDYEQEINMVEQRTFSPNQSSDFKKDIALATLIDNAKHTPQEVKVFPVKNVVIDMQPFDLQTKITNFRENGQVNLSQWNPFKQEQKILMISEYMQLINNRFYLEIKNHIGLQKISEALFVDTQSYFYVQTILYSCFYSFPLLLQMFYFENPTWINLSMVSCLFVTILFSIQEWIEFKQQNFWDYVLDLLNFFNVLYYFMFYIYFYLRVFTYLDQSSIPLNKFGPQVKDISNVVLFDQFVLQILTLFQLLGMAVKLMEVIRFNRKFGKIVQLVSYVLFDDVMIFFQFFIFWIVIFGFVFQILGNDIQAKTPDKELSIQFQYFIHSWSQGIRAGLAPNTDVWRELRDANTSNKENWLCASLMIGVNWLIQFANEFFMKIVLFSFLIGLVCRSINASILNQVELMSKQQCQMNREASLMWRYFGQVYETGMYVLSADLTNTNSETEDKKICRLKNQIQVLRSENDKIKAQKKAENAKQIQQ